MPTVNLNTLVMQAIVASPATSGRIPATVSGTALTLSLGVGNIAMNQVDGRQFMVRNLNSTTYLLENCISLPRLTATITGAATAILTLDGSGTVLPGGVNSIPIHAGFAGRIIGVISVKNAGNSDAIVYDFDTIVSRNGSGTISVGYASPSLTPFDIVGTTFGSYTASGTAGVTGTVSVSYTAVSIVVDNTNFSLNITVPGIANTTLVATAFDIRDFTF